MFENSPAQLSKGYHVRKRLFVFVLCRVLFASIYNDPLNKYNIHLVCTDKRQTLTVQYFLKEYIVYHLRLPNRGVWKTFSSLQKPRRKNRRKKRRTNCEWEIIFEILVKYVFRLHCIPTRFPEHQGLNARTVYKLIHKSTNTQSMFLQ